MVQSTLLHFSSESGPSGNFRDFQISRKLCRLSQGIGEDTLGNSRHQNSSFQIDYRAFMHILLDICMHLSTHDRCVFVWCLNLGSHFEMTNPLVISKWGPKLKHQMNTQRLHGPLSDHGGPLRKHLLHILSMPFVNLIQEKADFFSHAVRIALSSAPIR